MTQEKSYQVLLSEVNQILSQMEKDSLSIDDIHHKIEDAYVIIDQLKKRLFDAEARVEEIIQARTTGTSKITQTLEA